MNNIYNLIFTFLDDALELLKIMFPNFQTLATGATVLIILIRIYKKWKKQREPVSNTEQLEYMVRYLYEKEGGPCVHSSIDTKKPLATRNEKWSILRWVVSTTALTVKKFINSNTRRMKRMKDYLRKLGSRKFQALLTSLVVNIVSAALFMTGTVDIDGVLNQWMPIINMTVLTVSTWVYIAVEGGVDKANATKAQAEIAAADEPIHPLDTH